MENAEPAQHELFRLRQQIVAPVQRRTQCLMLRQRRAPPLDQERETIVETRRSNSKLIG
jgi:hypothetical protein